MRTAKKKKPKKEPALPGMTFKRRILLIAASALLCTAAFPALDLWPAAWFCLVPFFFAVAASKLRTSFVLGVLFGCLHFFGLAWWVFSALYVYTGAGLTVSVLFMLVIGLLLGLYYGLFAAAATIIMRSRLPWYAKPASCAAAWVCVEYMRANLFSGVPWELLGYSQYSLGAVIQIADITGVYGLSFLLVFVNCCLYQACRDLPAAGKALRTLAPAGVLTFVVLLYGVVQLNRYPALDGKRPVGDGIGIIQCSFLQDERWREDTQAQQLERYLALTEAACLKGARLIVWPEAALQSYLQERIPAEIIRLLGRHDVMLLLGGPRYTGASRAYTFYNSVFALTGGGIVRFHDKIHLLPFGEYFPLNRIDLLRTAYAGPRQYSAGTCHTVLDTPAGRIGTPVCFEIAFPAIARGFVEQGAGMLVTVSNDAWFGRSSAHYQHFSMAVLRAVEFRRPVLRSANTGISGHIDRAGRILERIGPFQEGLLMTAAEAGTGSTFYCRYGDVFAGLCCIVFLCCMTAVLRRRFP